MNIVSKIIAFVLLLLSLYLAYRLVFGIKADIDFTTYIKENEGKVIERLKLIREAEKVYQEVNGQFTSDFDKLIAFVDTATYYITSKREEVISLDYGADSSIFHIDTIGTTSVRDRVFKEYFYVTAADTGVFQGFSIELNAGVVESGNLYTLTTKNGTNTFKALEGDGGIVFERADLQPGDRVLKGQPILTIMRYRFDPNTDISQMRYVPETESKQFSMFAAKIDKGGVTVDVVEVVDTAPKNPARKEGNEILNQKPLRFGSQTNVTLSGNWE